MIPKFKTYLKESVWGSIRKKSLGLETRIEETMDKFYEYLEDHYSFNDQKLPLKRSIGEKGALFDDYIRIPISENFPKYICLFYAEQKTYIRNNAVTYIPNLYKKIEENFKVTENNPNEFYTLIEPIDGESDSKFCLTLIEFMMDNIDERNEPLIFRKELSESIWGSIRNKSLGQTVRGEDDINHMDIDDFKTHIENNYIFKDFEPAKLKSKKGTTVMDYEWLAVPLCYRKTAISDPNNDWDKDQAMCLVMNYVNDKKFITISEDIFIFDNVLERLKYEFTVVKKKRRTEKDDVQFVFPEITEHGIDPNEPYIGKERGPAYYKISPKDGSKCTNDFFIKVLDYLITSGLRKYKKKVLTKKKEPIEESVWGDLRKKSLGQEERLEDNVDLMEGPEFFEYLKKNYKYNTEDTIAYNKSNNFINIRLFESKPFIYKYLQYKIHLNEIVTDLPTDKMSKDSYILLNMANENKFDVVYVAGFHKIYPSNGEVTNRFFLEVLDYIIDQVAEIGPKEIDKL